MSNQVAAPLDVSVTLAPYGAFGPRSSALSGDYPLATLFIGIGQVGWQAVSRISSMMAGSLTAKDLNHVQYFAIARRPAVMPEGRLGRENSLLLTLEETDWAHVPGRYSGAGVARWWPKPPRDRSLMADYTSIRAYGRLLLYDNPNLVNETILQRVNNLVQASKQPQGDLPRLIVLTASIAEAEGSGMLFDLAWLLRLQLVDAPTTIVAILSADSTAETEQARTLAVANVYATLKELDAVMANPAQYPIGLPVPGGTSRFAAGSIQRPLNYLLVTGDALKPVALPPDAALAEMAVTWALTHVGSSGPDLSPLPPPLGKAERFEGYTLFNVSKLSMPVGAGIDLIGASVAQQILSGMMTLPPNVSADDWVETTMAGFKQALVYDKLFEEPKVGERLNELIHKTTPEAMTADVRSKDKDFSMRAFAEGILRRLEQEDRAVDMIDQGHTAIRLETLRTRAEDTLDALQRRLATTIASLPTLLSCQQGNGLQWTIVALEELSRRLNEMLNKCRDQSSSADVVWQEARRHAIGVAQSHDDAYSGIKRRLRGTVAKDLQELSIVYDNVTHALAERIRWSVSAVAWQQTWEQVDKLLDDTRRMAAQVENTSQEINRHAERARLGMDAAAQVPAIFPAGVLVDNQWFQDGSREAMPPNLPPRELIVRVYRQWAHNLPHSDRRVERFLREVLTACRQFLMGKFHFETLPQYIVSHAESSPVRKAVVDLQKAAVPQWMPAKETSGWVLHEWLRAVPQGLSLLPAANGSPWKRLDIQSPDADEITFLRLAHKVNAEQIPQVRGPYRRAYDRTAAEGVPLHIDRRWDATLADLVRNTAQSEISQLWEAALQASSHGAVAMREPLVNLVRTLAIALGIDPASVQRAPTTASDFTLTVYPLPTYRLRLPPSQCPIVYCYSGRRPRELGEEIHQAVASLGLAEPFVFVVNVNNRRDIDLVVETMSNESFNVVVLDEARFKRVVGSRQPLSALGEIVLSEVDLTLVSPFYTKAPVPERMFYGREREIKDVRRKIKTHSVALIGGRRIGKTSTLQQIERLLRVPDSGYIPYYLDCHNAMQYTHFFNNMARRWGIKTEANDPTAFEDIVAEIKQRHLDMDIIFLFDEVDRLLTMDMEQEHSELLFRTFRALSNEGKAHFIFSGERWLARAMENSYSALFNFALPVRLQPLDKPVVARLVSEPFEMMNIWLEDGPTMINRIYEISAGHPNIVQMICQEMIVALAADKGGNVGLLNSSHLERALDQHSLQEDIVHTIWGQMSELARLITLLWPEDERDLSLEQIALKVRGVGLVSMQIRDLQEAMKDLELYCFVTPKGRQYELVPVAFPALLDYMTAKSMEIGATVEAIQAKQKKELFSR